MKTFRLFALLALVACITCACQKKATYLKADVERITAPAAGVEGSVALHSDGSAYQIDRAPEWANVTLTDSTLTYKIGQNTTGSTLDADIVVVNGDQTLVISVIQGIPATVLSPKKGSVSFSYEGGTEEVEVQTDATLVTVEATEGFKASFANGKVTIEAAPGDGNNSVEGKVTLHADELTAEIKTTVRTKACATCGGSGKVRCRSCGGRGYIDDGSGFLIGCTGCGGYDVGISSSAAFRAAERGLSVEGSGRMRCPTCGGKGR